MTDTLSTTSELSAINTMISMVGKAPLNTLSNLSDVEAIQAQSLLQEVSRQVQAKGLTFNTEPKLTLAREAGTNKIPLPANTAQFRPSPDGKNCDDKLVQRGSYVYDVDNTTYVFSEDIEGEIISLVSFDTMPEYARQYIMVRAGRKFQDRFRVSNERHRFYSQDEMEAKIEFDKQENRVNKYKHNLKRGGGYVAETLYRHRFLGGY